VFLAHQQDPGGWWIQGSDIEDLLATVEPDCTRVLCFKREPCPAQGSLRFYGARRPVRGPARGPARGPGCPHGARQTGEHPATEDGGGRGPGV